MFRISKGGRTYESFSKDIHIVSCLGAVYIQGIQSTGNAITAKHFLAYGTTLFNQNAWDHIDQRNAELSEEESRRGQFCPYHAAIEHREVFKVMITYSRNKGNKLHGN